MCIKLFGASVSIHFTSKEFYGCKDIDIIDSTIISVFAISVSPWQALV